jgi:D-serine deaminase-like pyridoxal phosphate-dependent protein
MDRAFENHASYIGRPASELPTPSLIVDLPVLRRNVNTLHENVEKLGIGFRPHVKTLKVCRQLSLGVVAVVKAIGF